MENLELSKRQKSLKWFSLLSLENQRELIEIHKPLGWEKRKPLDLTGREVEILFEIEILSKIKKK